MGQAVTAVLEMDPRGARSGELYDQGFKCALINVYQLRGYKKLEAGVTRDLDQLVARGPSVEEFTDAMKQIRARSGL
jgi:hypothetical protein